MVYSRYCDDITFSTSGKYIKSAKLVVSKQEDKWLISDEIELIANKHSFQLNHEKVRVSAQPSRLEVTGLTINEFPNVRRKFVDEIRGMLHAWETFGLNKAQSGMLPRYRRQLAASTIPPFERVLRGKLLFLRMVRGIENPIYTRLSKKFNQLLTDENPSKVPPLQLSDRVVTHVDLDAAVFVIECTVAGSSDVKEGSAFFLKGVGLVTCEHVLRRHNDATEHCSHAKGDVIRVYNQTSGIEFHAAIEALSVDRDLAVLKPITEIKHEVKQIYFQDAHLEKGAALQLVGFPNFNPSKSITIAPTHPINFFKKTALPHFEIDTLIRAGNSGGPVVDANLRLKGVAKEGATQDSGNNAVIVANELFTDWSK